MPFWQNPLDRDHLATLLRAIGKTVGFKVKFKLRDEIAFMGMINAAVVRRQGVVQNLKDTVEASPDLLVEVDSQGTIHNLHAPDPSYFHKPPWQVIYYLNIRDVEAAQGIAEAVEGVGREGRQRDSVYRLEE